MLFTGYLYWMKFPIIAIMLMSTQLMGQNHTPKFDVQGHRGCRGLKPENTIPAFLTALDSGVTTLEMDVVITKDRQVVVSHEPWMNVEFCLDPEGKLLTEKDSILLFYSASFVSLGQISTIKLQRRKEKREKGKENREKRKRKRHSQGMVLIIQS